MANKKKTVRDEMVLEVQQWLNATYTGVVGYEQAPENGLTGWPTIYSLREGLQHELGLTSLGEGFGDATKAALAKVIGDIKVGYKGNIAQLIQGAFQCKGIDPNGFSTSFTSSTEAAFKELQSDAGLSDDGVVTVNLMAALFDMSAFVLVSPGKAKVRELQQWLNSLYSDYTGIMPCDGIYQRNTNVALIYALQRALGMDANIANGNFGPGTEAALRDVELSTGSSGELVQVTQWGLYLNGVYDHDIDDVYSSNVADAVADFRKFMQYDTSSDVLKIADYTVIKGLLTSNGDTSRGSVAIDCATQLTATDVSNLASHGITTVGRYLTGTVGSGSSERPKNLTVTEAKAIIDGGMKLFPIYEDGGYVEDYFTAAQGTIDAQTAIHTAAELGLPYGTVIYFAIDVDIQEGNIPGIVIPYLQAVQSRLSGSWYRPGVYGTRNVCLHAQNDLGYKYSFVANMSYGWSGNLGFSMPTNWAFDQFTEETIEGIDVDRDAYSGKDKAVSELTGDGTPEPLPSIFVAKEIINSFPDFGNLFADINWAVSLPEQHVSTLIAEYYCTLENEFTAIKTAKDGVLTIEDGKIIDELAGKYEEFTSLLDSAEIGDYESVFNGLAPMIGNGNIYAGLHVRDGLVGVKIQIEATAKSETSSSSVEQKFTLTLETYLHNNIPDVPIEIYTPVLDPVNVDVPDYEVTPVFAGIAVVVIAAVGAIVFGPEAALAAGVIALFTGLAQTGLTPGDA